MEKCAAESCVSERDVLRISLLSCGKNIQRPKCWIVCFKTDLIVTTWEGNEISDYVVHDGDTDHEKVKFAQGHLIFVFRHYGTCLMSSFRHLEF
jgi:hypothetical protein